jgi:hypothetical protein
MVLAVDGNPFLGHDPRSEPKPKAKEVTYHRVQRERMVSLTAVQVDGDRRDRDLCKSQRYHYIAPPWHRHQTGSEQGQVIEPHRIGPAIGYVPAIAACVGTR